MKDKLLQIRVEETFLAKLEYLQKINNYKSLAETIRKIIDKEYRKEQVTAKWELHGNDDDDGASYWCSNCHEEIPEDYFYSGYEDGHWVKNDLWHYCPKCGAKMESI